MKKKVLIISLCLLIIALWAASIYLVLELNNTSTNNPDLSTNMDVSTTLKESELQNDSSFSVGNYLYNSLSKTIEELSTKGFDNYIYLDQAGNSISNIHGYIIIGQKPEVGTAISYSDSITFTCVSFQAYLDEKIIGQPPEKAVQLPVERLNERFRHIRSLAGIGIRGNGRLLELEAAHGRKNADTAYVKHDNADNSKHGAHDERARSSVIISQSIFPPERTKRYSI